MVGLCPSLAFGGVARRSVAMKAEDFARPLALPAFRHKRVPSVAGLRLDARETGSRRRVWEADEVLGGGVLDLSASVGAGGSPRLVLLGTRKSLVRCAHPL